MQAGLFATHQASSHLPSDNLDDSLPNAADLAGRAQSFEVIRRNGSVMPFNAEKISVAMNKAFLAVHGSQGAAAAQQALEAALLRHAGARQGKNSQCGEDDATHG